MNRWNLGLAAADYFKMRRAQLGREVSEAEVRAINGFVEYLVTVETLEEAVHGDHQDPGVAV